MSFSEKHIEIHRNKHQIIRKKISSVLMVPAMIKSRMFQSLWFFNITGATTAQHGADTTKSTRR